MCHALQQYLRLKTQSSNQAFNGKYKFSFWAYVGVTGWEGTAAKVPDIHINIGGDKVRRKIHQKMVAWQHQEIWQSALQSRQESAP